MSEQQTMPDTEWAQSHSISAVLSSQMATWLGLKGQSPKFHLPKKKKNRLCDAINYPFIASQRPMTMLFNIILNNPPHVDAMWQQPNFDVE